MMRTYSELKFAGRLLLSFLSVTLIASNCVLPVAAEGQQQVDDTENSAELADPNHVQWQKLMDAASDAWDRDDSTDAVNDYHQALTVAEKFGDKDPHLWTTLRKIGWASTVLNEFDVASKALERSLTLAQADKSEQGTLAAIASLYGLSRLHQKQENYAQAKAECQSAIDILNASKIQAPELVSRLQGLRSELMLVTIEQNLGHRSEKPTMENDLPAHPLLGGITEASNGVTLAPLKAEVPKNDPLGLKSYLDGRATTNTSGVKTPTLNGSSKIRATVAKMLDSYASVGLFVTKVPVTPPVIAHVLNGGPAQSAGLMKGDAITEIEGQRTNSLDIPTMHFMLCGRPGQIRNVVIQRAGREFSAQIILRKLYDFQDPTSEYIEYYWFLLYNNFVTVDQYNRLVAPYVHVLYE